MSASESSEDLEFNPFYQALQTRFVQQYDQAQQNCWLVCIPKATSLSGCSLTRSFIDMHLLQPSIYLKDQYTAVSNSQRLEWQLQRGCLECISSSGTALCIPVLSEELAYNRQLQQFKMFIIDRPLDPSYKPSGMRGSHHYANKTRRKIEEHVHFLKSFENHREPLKELNVRINGFLQNYLIVEQESLLPDTASKLETTVKQTHSSFMEANRRDGRLEDRRVNDSLWLSLESYVMEKVHSKVFPALCRAHRHQNEDIVRRCKCLRETIRPSVVGVADDYDCPYSQTLLHLHKLESFKSSLEQLYCLQDAMESIQQDAREHFTKTLRHGEPVPLASDDLIALLATILTHSNIDHLYSSLYYMENFHWPPSDTDRLSYVLVTFHAAMEYIRGPDVAHLLPKDAILGADVRQDRKLESHSRERSISPCPPSPVSSSSVSTLTGSSSASVDGTREDKSLPLSSSLSSSRRGGKKRPSPKHSELGPFLSLLVENEETISSKVWDDIS